MPSHDTARPGRAGFLAGIGSFFPAARFVIATPATWPFAVVPGLVLAVLGSGFVFLAIRWVRPAVVGWLPGHASWYGHAGVGIVAWLAALAFGVIGLLLALALTPPLSAPALERLVTMQEAALGVPQRRRVGWLREVWCGLRAQVFAALFALPALCLLWIAGALAPPLTVVTTPLQYFVGALSLAWNLFDYPLTLRDVRMRDRFALVNRHPGATLGFGAMFSALFMVPCFNILLLPIAVVAATRLVWRLVAEDPAALPALSSGPSRSQAGGAAGSSDR
jgi:uncharacterized protein involved in cysteine biosynthesis